RPPTVSGHITGLFKEPRHALGIMDVHLAAKSPNLIGLGLTGSHGRSRRSGGSYWGGNGQTHYSRVPASASTSPTILKAKEGAYPLRASMDANRRVYLSRSARSDKSMPGRSLR